MTTSIRIIGITNLIPTVRERRGTLLGSFRGGQSPVVATALHLPISAPLSRRCGCASKLSGNQSGRMPDDSGNQTTRLDRLIKNFIDACRQSFDSYVRAAGDQQHRRIFTVFHSANSPGDRKAIGGQESVADCDDVKTPVAEQHTVYTQH